MAFELGPFPGLLCLCFCTVHCGGRVGCLRITFPRLSCRLGSQGNPKAVRESCFGSGSEVAAGVAAGVGGRVVPDSGSPHGGNTTPLSCCSVGQAGGPSGTSRGNKQFRLIIRGGSDQGCSTVASLSLLQPPSPSPLLFPPL